MPEDHQAALQRIMAEIESRKSIEKTDPDAKITLASTSGSAEDVPPDDDDQQAALDKIMAEIQSRKHIDKAAVNFPEDPGEDELQKDQQAAKSMIVAGVRNRRSSDGAVEKSSAGPEDRTGELSSDQQAVLDNIMAEIGSRNNLTIKDPPQENQDENLTIDQFNDELNQLLSSASSPSNPPQKDKATSIQGFSAGQPFSRTKPADDTEPAAGLQDVPTPEPPCMAQQESIVAKNRPAKRTRGRLLLALILTFSVGGLFVYHFRGLLNINELGTVLVEQMTAPSDHSPAAPTLYAGPDDDPLSALIHELQTLQGRIEAKIDEIEELRAYYRRGIADQQVQIMEAANTNTITTMEEAFQHTKIDLTLRTIQRQMIYSAKLESPLSNLRQASEELLYLERRTRLYKTLADGASGFAAHDFRNDVIATVEHHRQTVNHLSADDIEVPVPSLESIWKGIPVYLKHDAPTDPSSDPRNDAIADEICKGSFERKFELSALSAKSARCLLQWSGKDLYLNEVTQLSPETAAVLAQWPGEWLSLNGLKELSAETARQLAKWQGKRLALNGLTRLSTEATQHLSRWQGEQLELIGLRSLGPWENYSTRLYLSEELRRRLEVQ
jgi:hypothetical protein